jgi:hypothetical protein
MRAAGQHEAITPGIDIDIDVGMGMRMGMGMGMGMGIVAVASRSRSRPSPIISAEVVTKIRCLHVERERFEPAHRLHDHQPARRS